jgi:tripartite-type tricarboxylate transporter receptor subunit TctC
MLPVAAIAAWASPASAQSQPDFYQGKTITIVVAVGAGAYDLYARVLARHMPNYIPGKPTIIVNNMPGAGGLLAANHAANIAPRDGTTLLVPLKLVALTQVLQAGSIKFDASKFNWIGSMVDAPGLFALWHTAPVKTLEDAKRIEVTMGSSGAGAETAIFPAVVNSVLGTRFKVVSGFKGMTDIFLGVERGELHGVSTVHGSIKGLKPDWLRDNKLQFLTHITVKRTKELPDTPAILEYAKSDDERTTLEFLTLSNNLGRAIAAPPGVPADRVAILRKAFDDSVHSASYLKETKERGMDTNPIPGIELQTDVQKMVSTPKPLVDKVRAALATATGANK